MKTIKLDKLKEIADTLRVREWSDESYEEKNTRFITNRVLDDLLKKVEEKC